MPNEIVPPDDGEIEPITDRAPSRPNVRMIGFSSRNPLAIAVVGAIAIGAGAILLTLGLALILALVAGATALGVGAIVVRSLTSKGTLPSPPEHRLGSRDPSLEVFPTQRALPPNDKHDKDER